MAFALLFLGLLPMVFLGGIMPGDDVAEDTPDPGGDQDSPVGGSVGVDGNFISDPEAGTHGATGFSGSVMETGLAVSGPVLAPVTEDDDPFEGDPVDPDSVLTPITDYDEPFIGDDVDPDTVLDPVDEIGEDAPAPEDATPLQDLLASETDFDAASGWLGDYGPETETETLDADDEWSGADDGLDATGQGTLSTFEGTPVV
ncbi:MAG TPA: hypothetical protein ENK80_05120, partial [Rhodobacterales bacterium]|nr:hypothetical protein [Rhodobacterales bacterium]